MSSQYNIQRNLRNDLEASPCDCGRYETFVAASLCNFSIRIFDTTDFHISATAYSAQEFTVARIRTRGGSGELRRERMNIKEDREDRYGIYVPISGELEVSQFGRREKCTNGSMAFLSASEPLSYQKLGDNDTMYYFMPRAFVEKRLPRADESCGRCFDARSGVGQLVVETIATLHYTAASMNSAELSAAAHSVAELALYALRDTADVASRLNIASLTNLARAKRIIRSRCTDPDLRLSDIARECGLSLRYLHKLFQNGGPTLWEYLNAERLRRARLMLEAGLPGTTSVTAVCFDSGFSSPSHFSTAFRRAYSVSPRDVLYRRLA
jgi:AraC-like DNA-binding protein